MYEKKWRRTIIDRIVPECGYYYIVFDPDYLLGDERLYIQLKDKGFELLTYTDEIDFRILFEEKIRSYTDKNISKELIIIVNERKAHSHIPYDLAVTCTHISVDVAGLVPEIDPMLIRNEVQLLRFLLHIHYDRPEIPESLLRFISEDLSRRNEFKSWDIKALLHDRDAFFRFLEEYINNEDAGSLLLGHSEIKVYLDNVIEDGLVYVDDAGARFGKTDELSLKRKLEDLSADIPDSYSGWLTFMDTWASASSSIYTDFNPGTSGELFTFLSRTKMSVNKGFENWLEKSYGSLYNHPPSSPVMLHHLPRYILQSVARGKNVVLLVIDGLSVSQWKVIRAVLDNHDGRNSYSIEERALFAWIPTLTSVSRQALLSGKLPLSISRFLHDTSREEKLWKNFWEDNDLVPERIAYRKLRGDSTELDEISDIIDHRFKVAAVVVDKIDSIMHGQKQGSAMMHKEVQHWADSAFLSTLLDILFHRYDDIFLTSDHGNDEAEGIGAFSQGSLIKEKGQRCRVYDSPQFRDEAQKIYTDSIRWPQIGLPENYFPLLAPYGTAFTREGTKVVTHGGASIDEVIVPFVHFSKKGLDYG